MHRISIKRLRQLVDYDPATGLFTLLIPNGRKRPGLMLGSLRGRGYREGKGYVQFTFDGQHYSGHIVAWAWMKGRWPRFKLDHADLITTNNKWENLRRATTSQNGMNRKAPKNNKTGLKGVNWRQSKNKFRATITVKKKTLHLGYFSHAEEAHQAYITAAKKFFGRFARAA